MSAPELMGAFPPEKEISDLIEYEVLHAEHTAVFNRSIRRYLRLPTEGSFDRVLGSIADLGMSMGAMLSCIDESDDAYGDSALEIATLFHNDDLSRIAFFETVAPGKGFKPAFETREEAAHYIRVQYDNDTDGDTVDCILMQYLNDVSADFEKLREGMSKTRAAQMLQIGQKVGRTVGPHLLDVAKVGASVGIGIWLNNRKK